MMMPPNGYPPYSYAPVIAPPRQWPVPAARHVPLIWTIVLTAVTVIAVGLIALSPLTITEAPAPTGTTLYASSLAHNDNAWLLANNAQGRCAYANGGLDAISSAYNATMIDTTSSLLGGYDPEPLCTLQRQGVADLRLSVQILPQANLNYQLQPAIFVHSDVALLFTPAGDLVILQFLQPAQLWHLIYDQPTNQWHGAATLSNTVVVQVSGSQYTIGLNGAQIYHSNFDGMVKDFPDKGVIALGAFATGPANGGEAAFADLSLTAP